MREVRGVRQAGVRGVEGAVGSELLDEAFHGVFKGFRLEGSGVPVEVLEGFGVSFGGGDLAAEMSGETFEDLGKSEAGRGQRELAASPFVEDLLECAGASPRLSGFRRRVVFEDRLEDEGLPLVGEQDGVPGLDGVEGEAATLPGVSDGDLVGAALEGDFTGLGMRFPALSSPEGALEVFGRDFSLRALFAKRLRGRAAQRTVPMPMIEEVEGRLEQFFEVDFVNDFLMAKLFDEPSVEDAMVTLNFAPGFLAPRLGVDAVDAQFGQSLSEGARIVDRVSVAVDAGRQSPAHGRGPENFDRSGQALGPRERRRHHVAGAIIKGREHDDADLPAVLEPHLERSLRIQLPDFVRFARLETTLQRPAAPRLQDTRMGRMLLQLPGQRRARERRLRETQLYILQQLRERPLRPLQQQGNRIGDRLERSSRDFPLSLRGPGSRPFSPCFR